MTTDVNAIRARLEALGNVRWVMEVSPGECNILAVSPSGKTWQVARTSDGLNKAGVVPDFIANAPADIRALLDRIAALETALHAIRDTPTRAVTNDFDNGYNAAVVTLHEIARKALEGDA